MDSLRISWQVSGISWSSCARPGSCCAEARTAGSNPGRASRSDPTAICLLVGAFLAVATAWQRAADIGARVLDMIPVTVPELLRQLRGTVIPEPRRDQRHRNAWTLWRRRHQYGARQAHQRWHAYADQLPR